MSYIEWQEAYETGIELIDEQHQSLLKLINQLERTVHSKNAEAEAEAVLVKLVDYIRYHFAEEEKLMGMNQYHDIDQHCEKHHQFIHQVAGYLKNLQEGKSITAESLLSFLKSWLNNHILREAKDFRSLKCRIELSH